MTINNEFCHMICFELLFFSSYSYLLPDKNRSSKQKTPVIKRTVNPVWNYTFVYEDVSLQELSERALELTIWDHDRLSTNEFLGGIRFSLGTGMAIVPFFFFISIPRKISKTVRTFLQPDPFNKPNF